MKLVIYDEYFTITNMNGKTVWYHAEKEAVIKMKNIFKEANAKQKAEKIEQKKMKILQIPLQNKQQVLLKQMSHLLIVMR